MTVSDAELFTWLLYYGLAHLHLSQDEVWLMPFGLLLDLWECHKQYNGQATRQESIILTILSRTEFKFKENSQKSLAKCIAIVRTFVYN